MSRISCDECSRADVLRAAARATGCRRSSRGCRCPPARADAPLVRRALGRARARRLRRRQAAVVRRGHRRRRDRRPSADPRHRLPAGRRRRAVAALSGRRPALPRSTARARGHGRHAVHRGRAPALAPGARAARAAARRGQGLGAAGGRLRPSRPVALHLAPLLGGRRDRPAAADRLARPLPRRRRRAGQPAAGPVDRPARSSRRSRRRRCRSRRSTGPTSTTSGSPGVWGVGAEPDARRDRRPRPREAARPGARGRPRT